MKRIIKWIKSLFKGENRIIAPQNSVTVSEFIVTEKPKVEIVEESFTAQEKIKSQEETKPKKKKRGRPRKKKKEEQQ